MYNGSSLWPPCEVAANWEEQGHQIGGPFRFMRKWYLALDSVGLTPKMKGSRGQESCPGHFSNCPQSIQIKNASASGTRSVSGIWLRQEMLIALQGFRDKL